MPAHGLLRWCLVEDRLQLLVGLWSGRPAYAMKGDRSLPVLQPHNDVARVVLDDLGVQFDGLRHLRLLPPSFNGTASSRQRDLLRTGLGDRERGCPRVSKLGLLLAADPEDLSGVGRSEIEDWCGKRVLKTGRWFPAVGGGFGEHRRGVEENPERSNRWARALWPAGAQTKPGQASTSSDRANTSSGDSKTRPSVLSR